MTRCIDFGYREVDLNHHAPFSRWFLSPRSSTLTLLTSVFKNPPELKEKSENAFLLSLVISPRDEIQNEYIKGNPMVITIRTHLFRELHIHLEFKELPLVFFYLWARAPYKGPHSLRLITAAVDHLI